MANRINLGGLTGSINSGQLVGLRRSGNRVYTVALEVSAAGHVSPRYEMAGEAPRIYGEFSGSDIREAWMKWACALVLGPDREHEIYANGDMLHRPRRERERAYRAMIADHLSEIPER